VEEREQKAEKNDLSHERIIYLLIRRQQLSLIGNAKGTGTGNRKKKGKSRVFS
jgi:hypothetical protein